MTIQCTQINRRIGLHIASQTLNVEGFVSVKTKIDVLAFCVRSRVVSPMHMDVEGSLYEKATDILT